MKIYHTATQEDYDALMVELEQKGLRWVLGDKPTHKNIWRTYEENTYIKIASNLLTYGNIKFDYQSLYSDHPLIEYKAKGAIMDEKQFKQQSHDIVINIASTIGTFTTGLEFTDDDLAETQKLVKKFDETLTEFIDSRKPKFEVGDYVVNNDGGVKWLGKIIEIDGERTRCNWYDTATNKVRTNTSLWDMNNVHATPEEIAEYKAALNFHEHGRKPFEIKDGDLVANGDGISHIVENAHNNKELFLLNNLKLLATAEELEKWLADGQ